MAVFAEIRGRRDEQLLMVRAMWRMASRAVLFNRRMFPHERSTLIDVAFVAKLIDVIRLQHSVRKRTVWVVAVITADFAFHDRVV